MIDQMEVGGNIEYMFPVEKYKYDSLDMLMNNIDEAGQGIKDCINKIVAQIADHLR
jgi:hypothetical protein